MLRNKFNRSVEDFEEVPPREKFPRLWLTAPSLRPNDQMMQACAVGDAEAIAIRDAWRCNHPVTVLHSSDYDAMIAKSESIVFHE